MDLISIYLFVIGACIGSFLNVCIYRLPEEKSIISPPSHCPFCKNKLKWYHNIPILSYIFLRGKCAYCNKKISIIYVIVELLSGISLIVNYHFYGFSFNFFFYSIFIFLLLIVIFADIKYMIIPDEISIGGTIIGFIFSFFPTSINWKQSLLGILIGGGILLFIIISYYFITKKEGMGGGDVKLLAMIGAYLGPKSIFFVIFFGSFLGVLIGVPFMLLKGKDRNLQIPFGPFLSVAAIIYLYFGDKIINLYLNLF